MFSNIKEYNETLAVNEIQKYLSENKYKNNGFKEISSNLYPKFINHDDKVLLKLIKRLLIIYKRCHYRLLHKMIHRWEINCYKIKFNINNELKNELEEPKLEKNPKLFSNFIKEDKNNKKIKLHKKENNKNNSFHSDKKQFDEVNNKSDLIKKDNIDIEEIINNNNNSKDLIDFEYNSINEPEKNNIDICNIYNKNPSINISLINNYKTEMIKSKSVDKLKNISFNIEKPKKWEYSYYRKKNNEETEFKSKNKKKLMSNIERQQLFNNLYNDCQKRKEKFQKMKIEKEAQFNILYTFTPKVFQNRLNEKYMKNMTDSKFYVNTNLNTNILEKNKINNTISTSNIGANIKEKSEENKNDIPLDFISRLSEYEKIKKQNLEKIKNEIYLDYEKNKIGNRNKKSYDKILNNHLLNDTENFLEVKKKNIEKIKQDMYKEQGITFQPKTNKIFNNKIKNDIIERNNEFMREKKEKMEKYSHIKEKECTFKPKINNIGMTNTKDIDRQSNLTYKTEQNNPDVSKRLFDYQKKYKENLEDIRSKYKESYSFNPIISKNTEHILNNRQKLKEKLDENINSDNKNYELLRKQIKLGELEELSKKLEEIKNENLDLDIKDDENLNKRKNINKNDKIYSKTKTKKIISENKDFINNNDENSNKIIELANDLVNNNALSKQDKIYNKNSNNMNDFGLLMNNNINKSKNNSTMKNFNLDSESSKGSKQIMNLNYYDNLL